MRAPADADACTAIHVAFTPKMLIFHNWSPPAMPVFPAFAGLALNAMTAMQDAQPPAIIVEGEKPRDEAELTDLARELAGRPRSDRPLARFEQPLCLIVAANDTGLAEDIATRIIANARAAKVRMRAGGCKPNALVTLSDDALAQLKQIRQSGQQLFAAPGTAPAGLSRFDRAYLKALYRMPPGTFASDVLRAAVLESGREDQDES